MKTFLGIKHRGLRHMTLELLLTGLIVVVILVYSWWNLRDLEPWSDAEIATLQTLTLSQLAPLPKDPSNAVADAPAAALLGQQLFFDRRLSVSGTFSCSSCHRPELGFTDGLQVARAMGKTARNTPSIVGTAYSPWLYWDGRKDSQWSQALAPLEDPKEQGSNRMFLVRLLQNDLAYRAQFEELFGRMPDFSDTQRFPLEAGPIADKPELSAAWQAMAEQDRHLVNQVFANMGKVIAAYERKLMPSPSRFDRYVESLSSGESEDKQNFILNKDERRGLRLFIGEARCLECHNGPLLTNNEFHNTGLLPLPGEVPDQGRRKILDQLRADPFSCMGPYSNALPGQCLELQHMRTGVELVGAMRTPSLRNLHTSAPFMHKGQMQTLREVLDHYNEAKPAMIGHNEASELGLSGKELKQLEAFLLSLEAPIAGPASLLAPL